MYSFIKGMHFVHNTLCTGEIKVMWHSVQKFVIEPEAVSRVKKLLDLWQSIWSRSDTWVESHLIIDGSVIPLPGKLLWCVLVSSPDPHSKRKGGSGEYSKTFWASGKCWSMEKEVRKWEEKLPISGLVHYCQFTDTQWCLVGKVWLSVSDVSDSHWHIGLQRALTQSL